MASAETQPQSAQRPIVLIATLLLGTGWGVTTSVCPLLFADLGLSDGAIGLLGACVAAGLLATALPAGLLLRRLGSRWPMVVALGVDACALAFLPRMSGITSLAALRLLDGACTSVIGLGTELLLLSRAGTRRARGLGLQTVLLGAGYLLGPVLARLLLHGRTLTELYAVGAGLIATAALLHLLHPGVSAMAVAGSAATSGVRGGSLRQLASRWELLRTPLVTALVCGAFHATLLGLVPVLLLRERGFERGTLVLMPALFIAGSLACTPLFTRLADRTGESRWLIVLPAIGAALTPLFMAARSPAQIALLAAGLGATVASISPIASALQVRLAGAELLGLSNAAFQLSYSLGRLAGPVVHGALLERYGGLALVCALSVCWLFNALLAAADARATPSPLSAPP